MRKLSGKLLFPEDVSGIKNSTVHVSVEDISRQDASSETVCKKVYSNVDLGLESSLSFSLDVPVEDENAHLIVKVHVDSDNDGQLSAGDFITTKMYSVITRGFSDSVEVGLDKI